MQFNKQAVLKERTVTERPLYVGFSKNRGRGVFVDRECSAGEDLLTFGGPFVQLKDVYDQARFLQIDRNLYLGSSGDIDDLVNHSCEPNCGLKEENGNIHLFTLREIAFAEEITFDYSTSMGNGLWTMSCSCGSKKCREKITDFKCLSALLQEKYIQKGIVLKFLITS